MTESAKPFDGKLALVTGASRGIGAATAEALAAGRLLDIQLLDHLVIGHDAYVSLRDRGVAFDRPEARARQAD